jgi:hypothetical protein
MRRLFPFAGALALAATLAAPSTSSAQQAFNFYVGGFVPRGEDTRDPDDVLVNNLSFLSFNLKDFNGPTIGGEWLVGLGDRLDAGLGVGLTSRTVPSVYADFVNSNGSEIEQDLKLRTVPFTATLRFLPLGRRDAFVPYIGAGVGVVAWRYSETGDFVDFSDGSIFHDTFTGTGAATGPVILGGARFPVGSVDIGGEVRYQNAKGDLPASQDFAGTKIDLGGFNYLLTFTVKF